MNETNGQDGSADAAIGESSVDVASLGFDRLLSHLRSVVERLEAGNLSLEDSLRVYERGVALARRGHSLLDNAEKRVELLVRGARGEADVAPLPGATADDGEL